jgi:hypothetical protein
LVGLIEKRFSVLKERGRLGPEVTRGGRNGSGGGGRPRDDRGNPRVPARGRLGVGNVDSRVMSGAVLRETRRRETRSGPGPGGSPGNALEYFSQRYRRVR